jgi:hypothetical protein
MISAGPCGVCDAALLSLLQAARNNGIKSSANNQRRPLKGDMLFVGWCSNTVCTRYFPYYLQQSSTTYKSKSCTELSVMLLCQVKQGHLSDDV